MAIFSGVTVDLSVIFTNVYIMAYLVSRIISNILIRICSMRTRMTPIKLPVWSRIMFHGISAVYAVMLLVRIEHLLGNIDIGMNVTLEDLCVQVYLCVLMFGCVEEFTATTTNRKVIKATFSSPILLAADMVQAINGTTSLKLDLLRVTLRYCVVENLLVQLIELMDKRNLRFLSSLLVESFRTFTILKIMIREENGYEFGSTFAYGQFLNFFWPATLFILTYIPYQVAKLVRWDPFENNSKIKTQKNASKLQYYMFFEGLKSTLNFTGSESVEELLVTYLNRLCNIFFFDKQSVQNEMEELQLPNKISHTYVISGYLNPIKGAPEDVIKGDVTDNDGKAPVSGVEKAFSILPFYSPLLFANVKTIKSVISWIFTKVRSFYKTTEDIESTEEKRKNDLNKVDFNSYITEKNYYKFLTKPITNAIPQPNKNVENILPLLLPEEDNSEDYVPDNDELDDDDYDENITDDNEHDDSNEDKEKSNSSRISNNDLQKELVSLITPLPEEVETLDGMTWNTSVWTRYKYRDSLNQCLTRNKYSELNPDGVLTEAFIERVSHNANKIHTHEDLEGELDLSCVICKVNTRKIVLWPCRCLAICDECRVSLGTRGFKKCACCNTNIEAYSKLNIV